MNSHTQRRAATAISVMGNWPGAITVTSAQGVPGKLTIVIRRFAEGQTISETYFQPTSPVIAVKEIGLQEKPGVTYSVTEIVDKQVVAQFFVPPTG